MRNRTEEFLIAQDPAIVRDTRHAVRRLCQDVDLAADTCETAVLLASETVTNAIVHGAPPARLVIQVSPEGIRVEVSDGTTLPPVVVAARPDATSGRGIGLIDILATRWGVQPHASGKTVWFEIAPVPQPTS
ncbi:ATP-binding protein [Pseudofrankia inefficax]|uniref:ATP-binding region ATPase domain protein n=1 Tax=Pseudofrankia inefficax (strain DSM 45817 / CECT 9037 / DDB 130130 / EuI1c) TaxID=298654 RepID=E3IVJ6_PSEI1|nr:ATP-binding protein [Pseudofrankia inefficax]ADP82502.1 ATP-binding region ATPase domain protein [Pseudofrankia inefficax]